MHTSTSEPTFFKFFLIEEKIDIEACELILCYPFFFEYFKYGSYEFQNLRIATLDTTSVYTTLNLIAMAVKLLRENCLQM